MEKIIKIGEAITFPARSTAGSLFSYKRNFGRDLMKDLMALASSMPDKEMEDDDVVNIVTSDNFSFDVFYRVLWVFAKSADPAIPDLEVWLDGFDIPPLDFAVDVFPQVQELMISNVKTMVKSKNGQAAGVKR